MFLQNVLQQRLTTIQVTNPLLLILLQNEEEQLNSKTLASNAAPNATATGQFAATNFLRTSVRLGSIRNGQLNYPKDQKYYEGAPHEHINGKVHEIVREVKDAIDRDILDTKKPQWDQSVGIVGHPENKEHHKILKQIRTGISDENIIAPRV